MSIKLVRINDHIVHRIPIKIDPRKVKGAHLCPDLYSNIYCVAMTNSGKSTVIWDLIKSCAGKHTKVIAFCSTMYNDDNWIYIRKQLEKKGIDFEGHTSTVEEGVDVLKELVDQLKEEARERDEANDSEDDQEEEDVFEKLKRLTQPKTEDKEEKPKKEKYATPDYIVIFDDISSELRTSTYETLLKQSRHYHIKTITSSQDLKDLKPASRDQIRLWLIFSGQSENRLFSLYESLKLRISYDLFYSLYKKATEQTKDSPRPFLYVDPKRELFRRNFNQQFIIPPDVK